MLKEVYNKYKTEYKNYLLLIKNGNFYLSLNNDAIVMNNLFNYKIKELTNFIKVGFPINSLPKVVMQLDKKEINYVIIDKEVVSKQKFKNNNYDNYGFINNYQIYLNRINKIDEILKNHIQDKNISLILDKVESIICQINF